MRNDQPMNVSIRLVFRLAITALLLFAQHVAVAHQIQHVLGQGPFQEKQVDADQNFHSDLCAFHADFESLLSTVGSTPPPFCLASAAVELHAASPSVFAPAEPVIPASRGPPRPLLCCRR